MNIIVHYPTTTETIDDLRKHVVTVHIDAITSYINSLSCPKSQKFLLLEEICNSYARIHTVDMF